MPASKPWTGIPKPDDDTIVTEGTVSDNGVSIPAGTLTLNRSGTATVVLDMYGGGFAAGLSINTVGEGGDVALNIISATDGGQTFDDNATIHDNFGVLDLGVDGPTTVSNRGSISVQGGIGNSTLNLDLNSTTSVFDNDSMIEAAGAVKGPQAGINITGPGHFDNNGTIAIAHNAAFSLTESGSFSNNGQFSVSDASGDPSPTATGAINFGDYGTSAVFTNTGQIETVGDTSITINAPRAFETFYAKMVNTGIIEAKGGTVTIDSPLTQTGTGEISIDDGGTVFLGGVVSGGIVQIDNGVLAFGGGSRVTYGPTAARAFASNLSFTGQAGSLDFSFSQTNVSETFKPISAGAGEVLVYDGLNRPLADIKLSGDYAANDFTAVGAEVNFNAHPVTLPVVTSPDPTLPVPAPVAASSAFVIGDQTTGENSLAAGDKYSGPVSGIDRELVLVGTHNLNIITTAPNCFSHTGSGDDAINVSMAGGNNFLDGSTGSNFLTGGSGNDTFFLDDRNLTSDVYSTIVNFHAGDNATIFGVNSTDFKMNTLDDQGAVNFKGLDSAFTAPGQPNASMVLTGYTVADLSNGRLTVSYGTTSDLPGVPGSQYLNIHAN